MNGLGNVHTDVTREHLEIAKSRLLQFEAVAIMEEPESYRVFNQLIGKEWDWDEIGIRNVNKRSGSYVHLFDGHMTEEKFRAQNELDYEFYEYARNVSHAMQRRLFPNET